MHNTSIMPLVDIVHHSASFSKSSRIAVRRRFS